MRHEETHTFTVRPPALDELPAVQAVFNDKSIIADLGGFTMTAMLTDKIKRQLGLWVAQDSASGAFVGATMCAGRPQCHLLKFGSVGVLEAWRRKRIGTALYVAMTAQGLLEGRRLFEDTIVGDNRVQFVALPALGIKVAGELRHRTGSAKSIFLFQLSLLDAGVWDAMLRRLPAHFVVELRENSFSDELWQKNMDLARAHALTSHLPAKFAAWREALKADARFRVVRGDDHVRPHPPRKGNGGSTLLDA